MLADRLAALVRDQIRDPERQRAFLPHRWDFENRVPAAVCVPVVEHSPEPEVWCIVRPASMRQHARELGFPGGKPEPGDTGLLATALREMSEEVGVPETLMRPLGGLPPVPTATSDYLLHPFVVMVDPAATPDPAPEEVAALIRTPVPGFFDGRVGRRGVIWGGQVSPIFDFEAGSMYGASAHILEEFLILAGVALGLRLPAPVITGQIPWA